LIFYEEESVKTVVLSYILEVCEAFFHDKKGIISLLAEISYYVHGNAQREVLSEEAITCREQQCFNGPHTLTRRRIRLTSDKPFDVSIVLMIHDEQWGTLNATHDVFNRISAKERT